MKTLPIACLLALGLAAGSRVLACSCAPPPPPKKALEEAAGVFLGEVTKVTDDGRERTAVVRVERWWKGGDGAEVTVTTSRSGAACGVGFEKGKRYLVYAHKQEKDERLHASLCSRTQTADEAERGIDLKALGEGKAPAAGK